MTLGWTRGEASRGLREVEEDAEEAADCAMPEPPVGTIITGGLAPTEGSTGSTGNTGTACGTPPEAWTAAIDAPNSAAVAATDEACETGAAAAAGASPTLGGWGRGDTGSTATPPSGRRSPDGRSERGECDSSAAAAAWMGAGRRGEWPVDHAEGAGAAATAAMGMGGTGAVGDGPNGDSGSEMLILVVPSRGVPLSPRARGTALTNSPPCSAPPAAAPTDVSVAPRGLDWGGAGGG